MRNLMRINILTLLLLTSLNAHAEITDEEIAADCLNIKNIATAGDKYYKLKQYTKAREQYEQQAAWSESCQLNEEKIATAYNNVALTYIHQADYLKANAWLQISPNDKKTIFNSSKISNEIEKSIGIFSNKYEGEYWLYVGKSLWNVIVIKRKGAKYLFNFEGFYAGLMTMYYGPNMGEFSTTLDINNGKAHYSMAKDYDYGNCVYDFTITNETLSVVRISGESCGFGHNVSADGVYSKVGQ